MQCAWDLLIRLLPVRYREITDKLGKTELNEVRLRRGLPPELVLKNGCRMLESIVTQEDLRQTIQFASQHSPWAAGTLDQGYITAPGGHRVGVFGRFVNGCDGKWALQTPSMICIRVARDYTGIAAKAMNIRGSVLIIGPPGCGKTTFLRDLIRQNSDRGIGNISVVDEREELFPMGANHMYFSAGKHTDVLSGCNKIDGIHWALRNMTPSVIAVDEITQEDDCKALLHAGWCGVNLFATAHAGGREELYTRPVYRKILEYKLFENLIIMSKDKTWWSERIIP